MILSESPFGTENAEWAFEIMGRRMREGKRLCGENSVFDGKTGKETAFLQKIIFPREENCGIIVRMNACLNPKQANSSIPDIIYVSERQAFDVLAQRVCFKKTIKNLNILRRVSK